MKYAIISPIDQLYFSDKSTIHMSLTHLVLSNSKYRNYYKSKADNNEYIILDNSAFELEQQGIGVGIEKVLQAAAMINASEIILTDVLFDGEKTIKAVQYDIEIIKQKGLLGKYKLMAVAQGKNVDEWLRCFSVLNNIPEIDVIGLSKLSCPISFLGTKELSGAVAISRIMAIQLLNQENIKLNKQLHCLGSDDKVGLEIQYHRKFAPYMRSMDSSNIVWYGCNNCLIDEQGNFNQFIFTKPDLENICDVTSLQCRCYQDIIEQNINTILGVINDNKSDTSY